MNATPATGWTWARWAAGAATLCGLLGAAVALRPAPHDLTVFAAASLRDVCEELGPAFEREHGLRVGFNFAGSNVLAEQIIASTKGGVFLSADDLQMDRVELTGRMADGTRRAFLGNRLALIAPADSELVLEGPADLARDEFERISLANPEAVPAGRYARAWLLELGLWDDLEGKVAPGVNVRAAVMAVEAGAAEAGICYRTDVRTGARGATGSGAGPEGYRESGGVRIVLEVDGPGAPEVRYHAAAVRPGRDLPTQRERAEQSAAQAFLDYLFTEPSRRIFRAHGFEDEPQAGGAEVPR